MSIFKNATSAGLEKTKDRLGGDFGAMDTGAVDFIIKNAYADKSAGGANFVHFEFVSVDGKHKLNKDVYWSNKDGDNFFLNKDDKTKKVPLPGFTVVDEICLVASGKPLCDQDTTEKQVKIYDRTEKKEVPKAREVLTELLDQPVTLGIHKQKKNKQEKTDAGYVATAEEVFENEIVKVFDTESKLTVPEAREEQEATFYAKWVEKNTPDLVIDKTTFGKGGGAGGAAKTGALGKSAPQASSSEPAAPKKSLFGKK